MEVISVVSYAIGFLFGYEITGYVIEKLSYIFC